MNKRHAIILSLVILAIILFFSVLTLVSKYVPEPYKTVIIFLIFICSGSGIFFYKRSDDNNSQLKERLEFEPENDVIYILFKGKLYQLLADEKQFYFCYLESWFKLLKKEEIDLQNFDFNPHNFVLAKNTLNSVMYKENGKITFTLGGQTMIVRVVNSPDLDAIEQLGIEIDETPISEPSKMISIVQTVSLLIGTGFLFVPFNYYFLFSILMYTAIIVNIVLYFLFPTPKKLIVPQTLSIFLGVRALMDFTFLSYKTYLYVSGIGVVIILVLFFVFSKQARKISLQTINILILSFVLSFSAVANLNYILDFETPMQIQADLKEKEKIEDLEGYKYIFILDFEGKELKFDVSEVTYHQYDIGDTVLLRKYDGFFSIEHIFL